ncbi:MAG: hypothetical protein KKB59_20130 [Spirochaetes bacterium]|nr:hypothetical protein [Spirochaetota bacterium]
MGVIEESFNALLADQGRMRQEALVNVTINYFGVLQRRDELVMQHTAQQDLIAGMAEKGNGSDIGAAVRRLYEIGGAISELNIWIRDMANIAKDHMQETESAVSYD